MDVFSPGPGPFSGHNTVSLACYHRHPSREGAAWVAACAMPCSGSGQSAASWPRVVLRYRAN